MLGSSPSLATAQSGRTHEGRAAGELAAAQRPALQRTWSKSVRESPKTQSSSDTSNHNTIPAVTSGVTSVRGSNGGMGLDCAFDLNALIWMKTDWQGWRRLGNLKVTGRIVVIV